MSKIGVLHRAAPRVEGGVVAGLFVPLAVVVVAHHVHVVLKRDLCDDCWKIRLDDVRSHVGQVLKPNDYPIRHTGSRPSSVNSSILFCRGHVVFRHFFCRGHVFFH